MARVHRVCTRRRDAASSLSCGFRRRAQTSAAACGAAPRYVPCVSCPTMQVVCGLTRLCAGILIICGARLKSRTWNDDERCMRLRHADKAGQGSFQHIVEAQEAVGKRHWPVGPAPLAHLPNWDSAAARRAALVSVFGCAAALKAVTAVTPTAMTLWAHELSYCGWAAGSSDTSDAFGCGSSKLVVFRDNTPCIELAVSKDIDTNC